MIVNINEKKEILESLENKDVYTYEDIDAIRINNIKELISVGQSLLKPVSNYVVNPYNYSSIVSKSVASYINTNNSNMVFDYNIYNNNIYVCLASILLENTSQDLDDETIIKIYFQFLYSKNIINF